jgi:nicotinamidase-related amidase
MTALVIIDMLNDFVTGSLKCEQAQYIVPNIKGLVARARAIGIPVVFANDAHRANGNSEVEIWGPHAIAGSKGAEVIPELVPEPLDYTVPKRRSSAFKWTDLELLLRENGVDTVILTGLHTNICVRHHASNAFNRGYNIVVPEDAVAAFTEKDQVEGVEYLRKVYGVVISSTKELLEQLR